jgi:hypothetical protein
MTSGKWCAEIVIHQAVFPCGNEVADDAGWIPSAWPSAAMRGRADGIRASFALDGYGEQIVKNPLGHLFAFRR